VVIRDNPNLISIAGLGVLGKPDAPITIVEFSDYGDAHCGRFHRETFPRIDEGFVQPGTVRYLVKHFPDLKLRCLYCSAQKKMMMSVFVP